VAVREPACTEFGVHTKGALALFFLTDVNCSGSDEKALIQNIVSLGFSVPALCEKFVRFQDFVLLFIIFHSLFSE